MEKQQAAKWRQTIESSRSRSACVSYRIGCENEALRVAVRVAGGERQRHHRRDQVLDEGDAQQYELPT